MGCSMYENDHYQTMSKKSFKIQKDNTKHYPNQDEASLLRSIMSDTGLTEEKVRELKNIELCSQMLKN